MPDTGNVIQPNRQDVVAKVIDGEAILIRLTDGVYYSMEGIAGWIWDRIEEGHYSLDGIAEALAVRYGIDRGQALEDLSRLAQRLEEEQLIVHGEGAPEGPPAQDGLDAETYHAPELSIYRDMGDLLALDPPAPGLKDIPWDGAQQGGGD